MTDEVAKTQVRSDRRSKNLAMTLEALNGNILKSQLLFDFCSVFLQCRTYGQLKWFIFKIRDIYETFLSLYFKNMDRNDKNGKIGIRFLVRK